MKQKTTMIIMLLLTLTLASCSSVPISSMWKMSKIKPLEINPKTINIAVVTHKAVTFGKDAVQIQMAYKTEMTSTSIVETFFGKVSHDISTLNTADRELLASYQAPDKRISIFSLDDETAQAMRVLQKRVLTLKNNGVKGSGSFSVGIKDVCLSDPNITTLTTNTLAKFNQKDGYILLTKDVDLLEVLPKQGITKQQIICQ